MKMIKDHEDYSIAIEYLLKHSKDYYDGEPTITDFEYDVLYKELVEYETSNPNEIHEYSPSKLVGSSIHEGPFEKFKHSTAMLSLNNVFNRDELSKFIAKLSKEKTESNFVIIQPKIDGLAISLHYKNRKLVAASTRGDGLVGENVTSNIAQCYSVPKMIEIDGEVEVRGEAYIPKSKFDEINDNLIKNSKKTYANPRNLAAGTVKSLNPIETKNKGVKFVAYYIDSKDSTIKISSEQEAIAALKKLNFEVPPTFCSIKDVEDIMNYINLIAKNRHDYEYEIDGAVVKEAKKSAQKELKSSSHAPLWAIAYKYPPEQMNTALIDVEWNVGRTGKITPVGILEPVNISGTKVSRVVLHNHDFIKNLNIKINSIVTVHKAAEIIPEIVAAKENTGDKDIIFPSRCPVCNGLVVKEKDESAHKCINKSCPAQIEEAFNYFVSKGCLDIRGMGNVIVKKCINAKLITKLSDLGKLTEESLAECIGSLKISKKIIHEIEKSKKIKSFEHLLTGLGIPGVGKNISSLLVTKCHSLANLKVVSIEDLKTIEGIGDSLAKEIKQYFSDQSNLDEIEELGRLGWKIKEENSTNDVLSSCLKAKTIAITGTLSKPRKFYEDFIKSRSGKISNSVTKKTDYLLMGENPGSAKYNKAVEFEVHILKENEFLENFD